MNYIICECIDILGKKGELYNNCKINEQNIKNSYAQTM